MHRGKTFLVIILFLMHSTIKISYSYVYQNLIEIPKEVFENNDLELLDFSENRLSALPQSIGCLNQLKGLYINNNKLTELPESIGSLNKLEWLKVSYNELNALPKSIGSFNQLKELYISNNKLTELPESIGSLYQLKVLDLHNNELTELPESIGSLNHLERFYLHNNKLNVLPESIGNLNQLKVINLYNNRLTTLPSTILNIQSLTLLDLKDNPLVERGEGDRLGWRDLRERFSDRVILDKDKYAGSITVIDEQDVYEKLRKEPLHWNIEKLKSIRGVSVPKHTRSAYELINIWKDTLENYEPLITDGRDMKSYILTLYNVDYSALNGWKMYSRSCTITKDLLEAVFVKLQNDSESAKSYVPDLNEALKWCPDRQIATLKMLYCTLYGTLNTDIFEHFVQNRIAELKNYILDIVLTPSGRSQNVHVRNTWRYNLRNILGLDENYDSRMGMFGQDIYGGNVGNVLYAFYTKFTPSYVIHKLREEINKNPKRLYETGVCLNEKLNEDVEYWGKVFNFKSQEDIVSMNPSDITDKGVEDILVKMGILVRCAS